MNARIFIAFFLSALSFVTFANQTNQATDFFHPDFNKLTIDQLLLIISSFHRDSDYYGQYRKLKTYEDANNSYDQNSKSVQKRIDVFAYTILYKRVEAAGIKLAIPTPENFLKKVLKREHIEPHIVQYMQQCTFKIGEYVSHHTSYIYLINKEFEKMMHKIDTAVSKNQNNLISFFNTVSLEQAIIILYNLYIDHYHLIYDDLYNVMKEKNINIYCDYAEIYKKTRLSLKEHGTLQQKLHFLCFYKPKNFKACFKRYKWDHPCGNVCIHWEYYENEKK